MLLLVFLPLLLYGESLTTSLRAIRRDLRAIVLAGTVLVAIHRLGRGSSRPHVRPALGRGHSAGSGGRADRREIRTIPGPRSAQAPPHGTFALVRARRAVYHQQMKDPLVSYSPKKLGFFWTPKKGA
ncbi:hypothetical protein ACFCZY_24425 [Streptomyces sp. NPDC056237]|uniref:hypothetical protein n=1 Tax=unclassified Streptomyces TaxID=2593676 RepID=UPI0035D5CBBC